MYKIGIVEVRCSNHGVATLCKIADPVKNRITLFTTEQMIDGIRDDLKEFTDNIEFCVKKDNESLIGYIKRISNICADGYDLVVLNTVRSPEFLFFKPNCKVVSFFYNLNWWFKDTKSLGTYFKRLFNLQSLMCPLLLANAITGAFLRRLLLSKIDGVLVEYPTFVERLNAYGVHKPVYFLPNYFFEGDNDPPQNEKLTFVIPGSINEKRKNYDIVIDAFNGLSPEIKNKVKLVLLGQPLGAFGERIIESCKKLNSGKLTVEYFTSRVPLETMNEQLREADIIIAPLRFDYQSATVTERYTYTKGTGSFGDSLRFGKPSIVPEEYNVAPELGGCFLKYKDTKDLSHIIGSLVKDRKELNRLKKTSVQTMKNLSLSNLRERFEEIVRSV